MEELGYNRRNILQESAIDFLAARSVVPHLYSVRPNWLPGATVGRGA